MDLCRDAPLEPLMAIAARARASSDECSKHPWARRLMRSERCGDYHRPIRRVSR